MWVARFPKRIRAALERYPSIRCDRQIMSGAPCVSGRRVPVWALAGRFAAGETISFIAEDYDLRKRDVVIAIRFACWIGNVGAIKFWKFYHEHTDEG